MLERRFMPGANAPFAPSTRRAQPSCCFDHAERTVASAAFDTSRALTKLALDEALATSRTFPPAGGFVLDSP